MAAKHVDQLVCGFYLNFIKEDRWKYLVRGLGVTLEVALFAAIAGIILGALLAIIRTTADKTGRLRFLNWLAKLYITVIRGTPVVVQLLIINFVIFSSVCGHGIGGDHRIRAELRSLCCGGVPFRHHEH